MASSIPLFFAGCGQESMTGSSRCAVLSKDVAISTTASYAGLQVVSTSVMTLGACISQPGCAGIMGAVNHDVPYLGPGWHPALSGNASVALHAGTRLNNF